jgi:hypothetical protein
MYVQEITPAISNSRPAKSCSPIAGKIGPFNTLRGLDWREHGEALIQTG